MNSDASIAACLCIGANANGEQTCTCFNELF